MTADRAKLRFYVDESALGIGKTLAAARSDTVHCGHPLVSACPLGAPDTDWIPFVADQGWVALGRDKRVRTRENEVSLIAVLGVSPRVRRCRRQTFPVTWTPEQDAALLAKLRRENAEFAAWSAGVQSGSIPLVGAEVVAQSAGFRAGSHGFDEQARRAATRGYDARELVAWAIGYGQGCVVRASES